MAESLLRKLPYPGTALLTADGTNLTFVWYEFIRAIATEARTSDTDGALLISGSADEVQLTVKAFTTQTNTIVEVRDADDVVVFSVDNDGNVSLSGTVDGRDLSQDGNKLDGIANNANNYIHPNHSGDVVSDGDGNTVIQPDVVGNDKLSTMAEGTIKGRAEGGGAGNPQDLTDAEVRAILLDGATLPTATVATDDKVLIQDTSDSDVAKTVTAQSIADLGSGAPILIDSVTASNQATVEFTGLTSTYHTYIVTIDNLLPITDAIELQMQVGDRQ